MDTIYKLKQEYASLDHKELLKRAKRRGLKKDTHNNLAWMLALLHKQAVMPRGTVAPQVYFDCSSGMLGTVCDLIDVDNESVKIASVMYQEYKDSSVSKVYPKKYPTLTNTLKEHNAIPEKIIYYDRIDVMEPYLNQGWSLRINCTLYQRWLDEGYTHALLKDQAPAGYWDKQILAKNIGVKISQASQNDLYLVDLYKAVETLDCDVISFSV